MKITFLGTGTSTGIPTIGVDRESCFSDDPRDNRLRSSILIEYKNKNIVVDCDPNIITLIGFSQGAILAHAIAQNSNIKNLIALSGYVDEELISFEKTNNLSIYISHGKGDEVIPFEESFKTNKLLDDHNVKYEFKAFDQGHGVNSENLKSFLDWLEDKY